jgi:LysR family transcriptional regulator, glycine cleavage system transcriptional activator
MGRSLAPLSAWSAFEAVARRLSFTRAAEELHVTPGAVSQQVRRLEQQVGFTLFSRTRREVSLTPIAVRILPDVQAAFQLLSRASAGSISVSESRSVTVSVAPSFATKWLLPRLPGFTVAHPEIDLRISATVSLTDFSSDGADIAIRFGAGNYPGVAVERLFDESVTPLCAPALLRKARLRRPEDLRRMQLIHDASIPGDGALNAWNRWLQFAGVRGVPAERGTRFSLAEHAIQAAIDGSGVVLARLCLAERDLAAGMLVQPFRLVMPLDVGYFLVMPRRRTNRYEVLCFREWLQGILRESPITARPRKNDARATPRRS